MEIKILGTGCSNCKILESATRQAILELGLDVEITKEEDIVKIMEYGIPRTPGLVVNGKVVMSGRVPTSEEIKNLLI